MHYSVEDILLCCILYLKKKWSENSKHITNERKKKLKQREKHKIFYYLFGNFIFAVIKVQFRAHIVIHTHV